MVMPKMGESVVEGTILQWLKKPGDLVEEEEYLVEVATDKVTTEIPCTHRGRLKEVLVAAGGVAKIGHPIALIEVESVPSDDEDTPVPTLEEQPPAPVVPSHEAGQSPPPLPSKDERFYSPLVRKIAKEHGLSPQELRALPGSGMNRRVTKKDLMAYLEGRKKELLFEPSPSAQLQTSEEAGLSLQPGDEVIEMTRLRHIIAERMLSSKRTAAHVTSFAEADVTALVQWKKRHAEDFRRETQRALTLTPLFLEAVIRAIQDYPLVNSSLSGDKIIRRKSINIGLAVALPSNELIVPVIRQAQNLSLRGLIEQVNDLGTRARKRQLKAHEVEGGTFTVSNIGSFGSLMGTPIIMQPQSAILALGVIKKRPVVIEGPAGDALGIRQMMFLSHSYDHRVIDGALGGAFVDRVGKYLENFDETRTIKQAPLPPSQQERVSPS